ncbi:FAD-binding domain-containing protein, partial [Choiromyces venosus 120613-1]
IKLQRGAGGHSYVAHGLGREEGGMLVIDMAKFNPVSLNSETGIATVGGGVRLGNMACTLYKLGERAIAHGTCPSVGISGHALYGGFGHPSRMWARDHILLMDVVLSSGALVTASEHGSQELFWALRGAGPSFGIAVGFKMRTQVAPGHNVVYAYTYHSPDAWVLARGVRRGRERGEEECAPRELGFGMEIRGEGEVKVRGGRYFGEIHDFHIIIDPLINDLNEIFGAPTHVFVEDMPWLKTLEYFAEGKALEVDPATCEDRDTFLCTYPLTPSPPSCSLLIITVRQIPHRTHQAPPLQRKLCPIV